MEAGMAADARDQAPDPIKIAAAIITDRDGRHLLVRKTGTEVFMQAGGKIEGAETPLAALRRELREELGLELDPARSLPYLGLYRAEAANEPGQVVEAHLFEVAFDGEVRARAEICEAIWLDPKGPIGVRLAPLTQQLLRPQAKGASKAQ
jgi:8-oxo-dGTP diphosphatase